MYTPKKKQKQGSLTLPKTSKIHFKSIKVCQYYLDLETTNYQPMESDEN